jgi:hypothetical protein
MTAGPPKTEVEHPHSTSSLAGLAINQARRA